MATQHDEWKFNFEKHAEDRVQQSPGRGLLAAVFIFSGGLMAAVSCLGLVSLGLSMADGTGVRPSDAGRLLVAAVALVAGVHLAALGRSGFNHWQAARFTGKVLFGVAVAIGLLVL